MFNVDVVVHEDATIDDFIDVLEEAGTAPRQYCRCIYVYNKIDMLSISQVDELARQPYSVVISVSKELNLEGLLERIWQELDLRRVYTKKKVEELSQAMNLELGPCCNLSGPFSRLHRSACSDMPAWQQDVHSGECGRSTS
eukprot:symbB.v1.2.003918.t1/scaffold210.1/size302740/9